MTARFLCVKTNIYLYVFFGMSGRSIGLPCKRFCAVMGGDTLPIDPVTLWGMNPQGFGVVGVSAWRTPVPIGHNGARGIGVLHYTNRALVTGR